MPAIKVRSIDRVVKQPGFCFILALHALEPTFFLQPIANQIDNVDAPGVRSVIERFVLDVRTIVEHRVQTFRYALQEIVANSDQRYSPWTDIFLGAGIDKGVLRNRYGVGKNVRRSIGDE